MSDDPNELDPTELPSTEAAQATAGAQEQIGPYRLLQKLGEGGMGEVWLAEQTAPVKRRVALKIIKQGMDTKQVVARFEAERQALAMMDHPAVAKVFDAGTTPHGRPYFVMEYVKGVPITEHCDRHRLTNRERLDLFMQVCEGVQHAHQKAIIHRDLKPSNVLVTEQDGKRLPKIIDFGVAKATAQKLTEKTLFTELGVLIGTPEYMSPEQAELTGEDVDTRTDVYSLGVMLYELLVGALPFDSRELRSDGYEGIRRKIREEDPHKPSTRLSMLGDRSTESAKRRRVDLPTLQRQLRGDLDWITMRALEKDRSRRYGSPVEFAADIGRYLADEPVLASPPSAAYRTRKFVRRHRFGVLAATAAVLILIGFAATMAVQAQRIAAERDRANAEAERANREAQAKGQVSGFLKDLFAVSDPGEARGNSITARELLDRGAEKIENTLADQPEVRAELMATIGSVYQNLGLYAEAEPLFEQAFAENKRVLGDEHPRTLSSANILANSYTMQGRHDEAEPLYLRNLEIGERLFGRENRATLTALNNLAMLYQRQQRYEEAELIHLEIREIVKRVFGDDHMYTYSNMHNLAIVYNAQGRYVEAEPLYVASLEGQRRVLGDDHWRVVELISSLASFYRAQGRFDEAEPLFFEVLDTRKRVFGDDHWLSIDAKSRLANVYRDQGRLDESESFFLEILETRRRVQGNDHPDTLDSLDNQARLNAQRGDRAQATSRLRQAIEAGYANADLMSRDPDLESLHGPEFNALVEQARKNAAAQRRD